MNKTNVYEDDDGKYDKIIDFLEEKERKEANSSFILLELNGTLGLAKGKLIEILIPFFLLYLQQLLSIYSPSLIILTI